MTTPSYWWVVGTGQVGYSRIWDGVSPDPTIIAPISGIRWVQQPRPEPWLGADDDDELVILLAAAMMIKDRRL